MAVLRNFEKYIIDEIGDEEAIDYWFMCGLPDGCDDEMLAEIASCEEYDRIIRVGRLIIDTFRE